MEAIANQAGSAAMSTGVQLQAAMLSKQKEVMEQQGQMAVQLVQSTANTAPQGNIGGSLNVYA